MKVYVSVQPNILKLSFQEPIEWWRNVEGHNLLDLMYSDIHQWLKVFQSYVQFTRLKVQTTPPKDSNTRVQMFERFVVLWSKIQVLL